jgi:hypothetical protein
LTETKGIIKIRDMVEVPPPKTAASEAVAGPSDGEARIRPFRIRKRIGSTTYEVEVYFSPGSRETLDEKILRLVRGEAMKGGGGFHDRLD